MSEKPATLDWLKYLAKKERRVLGISHSDALEIVAERFGFMDFAHAKREYEQNNTLGPKSQKRLERSSRP